MKPWIFLIFLFSFISFAQETDYSKIPQLQTKATFTTEVNPDKITLSIVLSEENTRGRVSLEELESRMKQVLISNNVDIQKQLTLTDLSSNFRDYFLKKTEVQKSKNYQLVIYDAVDAGKILTDLESKEISNVQLLKTEYSKLEELKLELKGKAILKAKKQAEEMVKNLNQKLGPALFISDMETNITNLLQGRVRGINAITNDQLQNVQLSIDFNTIRVDATVTVYFRLE